MLTLLLDQLDKAENGLKRSVEALEHKPIDWDKTAQERREVLDEIASEVSELRSALAEGSCSQTACMQKVHFLRKKARRLRGQQQLFQRMVPCKAYNSLVVAGFVILGLMLAYMSLYLGDSKTSIVLD